MQTFLFADLAGFTALTEAMGDEDAAEVAGDFCRATRILLPAHGGEEVKAIGDALLIRVPEAAQAVQLGLRIVREVGARHGSPLVSAGMHSGTAVSRDGDWFGSTVNVAARVAALATGGEVLLTATSRTAAGDLDGIRFDKRGRRELRNVGEPVLLFAAVPEGERTSAGLPVDPVCRMAVDPARSAGLLRHLGVEHHFCSLACAQAFAAEPDRFTAGES